MDVTPEERFRHRAGYFEKCLRALERRSFWAANLRLLLFLALLALCVCVWQELLPGSALWGAVVLAALFVATALRHDRILKHAKRAQIFWEINERALHRLNREFSRLTSRTQTTSTAEHPYALDLDILGERSLSLLVDDTATLPGEVKLWRWLLDAPASTDAFEAICARQAAIRELSTAVDFRERLEAEGRLVSERSDHRKADPARLIAWAQIQPSSDFHPSRWRWIARLLPPVTIALWGLWYVDVLAAPLWLAPFALQLGLALYFGRLATSLFVAAEGPSERLGSFRHLFEHLEQARFESPALAAMAAHLTASGAKPSVEMARLSSTLGFLRLRHQPLFHIPLAVLFLWDVHFAAVLAAWRTRCGAQLSHWFDVLAEFEALCSLAGFAALDANPCWPRLVPEVCFEAEGLGHPLIPEHRRVCNDVALASPSREASPAVLLVTGSNMAGKTTFLRTLGLNAVLALAGAPVCARTLRIGPVHVYSSMRISDSLGEGLSLFHAEVRRMKQILDASERCAILFLLDEVLHGTNTAERQLASKAIVRALVLRGAIGAIATHDVGLTELERSLPSQVRNVHFTDALHEGALTFDYRLRSGVVATSNALRVIRQAGIELPELTA
ncbi:MAG: DNA mismatch repair protein MutS, partial [Myxococcales bacterium]|nr:DNA mismatch repair protein MutS [Myxococcales bacterium]